MPGKRKTEGQERPIPENFIRAWRRHRGLSLEKLAEKAGLAVPTISNVEKRKKDVTGKTLLALANALETTPAALLSGDPKDDAPFWETWNQLRPEQKPVAIRVIQAMKDA